MASSSKSTALAIASFGAVTDDADCLVRLEPCRPEMKASSGIGVVNRSDRAPLSSASELARILLVDAAHERRELHPTFLLSIPATVKTLTSCREMYRHTAQDYALVILALEPQSCETAAAADFVRHRWCKARILLFETEPSVIDDWLYDERVDPRLDPSTVLETAIRLISKEKYWIRA